MGRTSYALTSEQVALMRQLRLDGHGRREIARRFGVAVDTVSRRAPLGSNRVSNQALREAFLRSGISADTVALRLGWFRPGKRPRAPKSPDSARVKRTLGVLPETALRSKSGARRQTINVDTARRIADAIGVDYWQVGAQ